LVHWKTSAIEKWALQYHIKASFQCASKISTVRKDLQDPCCKVCRTPHSKERTDEVESDHEQGMFQCSTCICTYHWDCLMQLGCYHNHDARPSTNKLEEWHCPACQSFEEQLETRRTERKTWLVNWRLIWEVAKMIKLNSNYVQIYRR